MLEKEEEASIAALSRARSIVSKEYSKESDAPIEVEFSDVIEKLQFAVDALTNLKRWKDKALKAERELHNLKMTVKSLRDEIMDSDYEVEKWKKRALRAEKENQDEIMKWKNKAIEARSDLRDDSDLIDFDGESYTDLVSRDDNSSLSTHQDTKAIGLGRGQSFRKKWNFDFTEKQQEDSLDDAEDDITVEKIIKKYDSTKFVVESRADDDSNIEAEKMLNKYLIMKGRYNSRRFDTSTRHRIKHVISEEEEV